MVSRLLKGPVGAPAHAHTEVSLHPRLRRDPPSPIHPLLESYTPFEVLPREKGRQHVCGRLALGVVAGGVPALALTVPTRPALLGGVPSRGGGAGRRSTSSVGSGPGRPAVVLCVGATVGSAALVVGADVVASPAAALCRHIPSLCTQEREH